MVHPAWLLTLVLSHACSVLSLRTGTKESSQKGIPRCLFPCELCERSLHRSFMGIGWAEPPVYVQVHPRLQARQQQQAPTTHGMQRRDQDLPAGRDWTRPLIGECQSCACILLIVAFSCYFWGSMSSWFAAGFMFHVEWQRVLWHPDFVHAKPIASLLSVAPAPAAVRRKRKGERKEGHDMAGGYMLVARSNVRLLVRHAILFFVRHGMIRLGRRTLFDLMRTA